MTPNPYENLVEAAEYARMNLCRVAGEGGVLEQIGAGEWNSSLPPADAQDLADLLGRSGRTCPC